MSSTVEQIKERMDIVDLVSQYVTLKRAGSAMKALCPFHSERTPSFVVSSSRQSYHCFGCGEHGDIFTFVEKMEGVDFKGALKILAEKTGVQLKYENSSMRRKEKDEKDKMFSVMEHAANAYFKNLFANERAIDYLKSRGLTADTISRFKIGFAPDDWHYIENTLVDMGFDRDIIEKTGLIIKGNKRYYDRFRSRIMFPIRDSAGRTIAFSGRIFDKKDEKTAKYINSPETVLYSKSKVLYGYDFAKHSIRKNDFVIFVEGQMDLIASHQAGYTNTVAISGTAFTHEHCDIISRMSKNMVLALDADDAGLKAVSRSASVALPRGFDVKVAILPEGEDPADILKKENGKEIWVGIIKNAKHVIEFLLHVYSLKFNTKSDEGSRLFKKNVEKKVLPFVAQISSVMEQEHFAKVIARKTGLSESSILLSVSNIKDLRDHENEERVDIAHTADYGKKANALFILSSIIVWQRDAKNRLFDISELERNIVDIVGEDKYKKTLSDINEEAILQIESMCSTEVCIKKIVEEQIARLKRGVLNDKRNSLVYELRLAEEADDEKKVIELSKEITNVNKQLEELSI